MSTLKLKIKTKTKTKTKHAPSSVRQKDYSFHRQELISMLTQQLQKVEGGFYVPNEDYTRLLGPSKKTTLDAAISVARRVHDAVSTQQPDLRPDNHWDGPRGFAAEVRQQELKPLEKWATKNNMYLDYHEMVDFMAERKKFSGGEHEVFYKEGDNYVTKFKQLWHGETYNSTLNSLTQHNKYFPESAYEFKGFTTGGGPHTDPYLASNSYLRPMYTQPYFKQLTIENARETFGMGKGDPHFQAFSDSPSRPTYTSLMDSITMKHQEMLNKEPEKKKELDAAKWLLTDKFARSEVTLSEIITYMANKGFRVMEVTDKSFKDIVEDADATFSYLQFINSSGVIISDLRPPNFIRDIGNNIVCIDPRIDPNGKPQADRIQEAINGLTVQNRQ